jgi:hypothetical protein
VAYHQQVIDELDKTLIPGAMNEELKALLVKLVRRSSRISSMPNAFRRQRGQIDRASTRLTTLAGLIVCGLSLAAAEPPDSQTHTVTIDCKTIQTGMSWKLTTQKRGEFTYISTFDPTMTAMLQVR